MHYIISLPLKSVMMSFCPHFLFSLNQPLLSTAMLPWITVLLQLDTENKR